MTPEALRGLLPVYGLNHDAPLALINRSENETWKAGDDALILRVHREGYHTEAEIRSELAWLQALQGAAGLRCVAPVAARDGGLLQTHAGQFVAAFAPIAAREISTGDDLEHWFGELGQISAALHAHARGWHRPPDFSRKRWDANTILGPEPHWGDWRAAVGLDTAGHAVLQRLSDDLTQRLAAYGTGPERFGLIHADLRLTNLMLDAQGLWAIDFDDCGFGWWMYDLAAALSFIETDARLPALIAAWCDGHGGVGPEDRAVIPTLIMLRRVLLTAWLASRADSDTAADIGAADYTAGSVALAEQFLTVGPAAMWAD